MAFVIFLFDYVINNNVAGEVEVNTSYDFSVFRKTGECIGAHSPS